jgi:hypothetical protein
VYEITALNELANDDVYCADVRKFAETLIADGKLKSDGLRNLGPLTEYGPDCAGTILRLSYVPRFAELDAARGSVWAELAARLELARG